VVSVLLLQKDPRQDDTRRPRPAFIPAPIVLRLKGVAHVDRDPDWVFSELHDPETLLTCVPGGSLTRLVGPRTFEARIAVGIGPFKFATSGTGRILESNPKARTASMTLYGHRSSNAPHIRIRMAMTVLAYLEGSEIQMAFRVVIADRTGLLSPAWVNPIACDLLDRTIRRVKQRLEDTAFDPAPTAA
jgi:carbon monoxide dehydrogenase subunit G